MLLSPQVAALFDIAPADHGADEGVDWAAVEAAFGRALPSDYVAFMARYGAGDFGAVLGIVPPLPVPKPEWEVGSVAESRGDAGYLFEVDPPRRPLDVDPAHLLEWGHTCGPDALYWLTTDPDPDRWPVVVRGRHTEDNWARYDCGMADFLLRVLTGRFDPWPLSVTWDGPLTWVHWREQQRRWLNGLDPISGELDTHVAQLTH
ncbi:hypothetical protein ABIA32_005029 [Streptacidiphilus sp. MAP12-20]|uniref:SMI1/KNR4 family protein n=1 Tax=Streptacidiphilus sp. MAP12-20 TaxID=3156299 RepID=UPI003514FBFB